MKSFLVKILIYSLVFWALCFGLQWMADTGLKKSQSNDYRNWNMIVEGEINAEVLVTGSSRAMRMIDPAIIDSVLNTNSYNIGMEGARLQSQLSRWDAYLIHNEMPKVIVQTVDLMSMGHAPTVFKKQQFLPYLNEQSVYNSIGQLDKRLFLDRYFPLYKYHGYFDEFKEGMQLFVTGKSHSQYTEYKGYECKDKKFNHEFQAMKDTLTRDSFIHSPKLVEEGFVILNRMIEDCQEQDIPLLLIFTPQYDGLTQLQVQTKELVKGFEKLAEKENVYFLNYVWDDINKDQKYFYNAMHLNKTGAEKFTKQLAEDIKRLNILK